MERDTKQCPKVNSKSLKSLWVEPSNGICDVGATLGHLGRGRKSVLFLLLLLMPTSLLFNAFCRLRGQTDAQNVALVSPALAPNGIISSQSGHK